MYRNFNLRNTVDRMQHIQTTGAWVLLKLWLAPNALITHLKKLYPGPISDKEIIKQSAWPNERSGKWWPGICRQGVLIIQDIVPKGVFVKIPHFLQNGRFTATKNTAKCRIHVKRAYARLKYFNGTKFGTLLLKMLCLQIISTLCCLCKFLVCSQLLFIVFHIFSKPENQLWTSTCQN